MHSNSQKELFMALGTFPLFQQPLHLSITLSNSSHPSIVALAFPCLSSLYLRIHLPLFLT